MRLNGRSLGAHKPLVDHSRYALYVVWKVERHSGVRLEVAPWQRRFPLLAAPGVYLRLRKLGVLR